MSSLKATHTAHRMASEVLNPHIDLPQSEWIKPAQKVDVPDPLFEPPLHWAHTRPRPLPIQRALSLSQERLLLSLLILIAAVLVLWALMYVRSHA